MPPAGDAPRPMGAREWSVLLVLSVLWGGSFFFYKILTAAVPPLTVVLGRVGIAAVLLNLLLLARGQRWPRDAALWRSFLVMGVINSVVPFSLIAFGETRIPSGLAAILNATTPIFAMLAAHVLTTHEKLSWPKLACVALGLAGVAVLVGPAAISGRHSVAGEVAVLLASLSYAMAAIYGRRFRGTPPLQVAAGQTLAGACFLLPIACVVDRPWTLPMPDLDVWLAFGAIGGLSTALAYLMFFRLLATAGATNLVLVTFLLPVTATALGALVLGERITAQALAGMALIGAGLAVMDGRLLRWRPRRSPQPACAADDA